MSALQGGLTPLVLPASPTVNRSQGSTSGGVPAHGHGLVSLHPPAGHLNQALGGGAAALQGLMSRTPSGQRSQVSSVSVAASARGLFADSSAAVHSYVDKSSAAVHSYMQVPNKESVDKSLAAMHHYMQVPNEEFKQNLDTNLHEMTDNLVQVKSSLDHMGKEMKKDIKAGVRLVATDDVAEVTFLGQEMKIDDDNATVVFVFPRGQPYGKVDSTKLVHDPLKEAHKIFVRQHNLASQETMNEGFETFTHTASITQGHYQKVVRRKLLQLLRKSGFRVTTFESVDKDEIFAKVSLDREGKVIKQLAQRFSYTMPFTKDAYKDVREHGIYHGHKPMCRGGNPVPAYAPYNLDISDLMEGFRKVDEIRIVEMQLHALVSVEQLRDQGIISNFFAAARHLEVQDLHSQWLQVRCLQQSWPKLATLTKIFEIPHYGTRSGLVRNFFGEEIAFFFRWFAYYTQHLGYLGFCGLLFWVIVHFHEEYRDTLHICFSGVLVIWATVFNQVFRNRMARATQDWGMKEYEIMFLPLDRANYDANADGSWSELAKRVVSYLMCACFCISFIAGISIVEEWKREQLEADNPRESGTFFKNHGSLIVVTMIKVWSIAWGYIAPVLVALQNHRTQERFDNALTGVLAGVKIFVTLWNFVYLAFVKNITSPTCANDLDEVASLIWGPANWAALNGTEKMLALAELATPTFSYNATRRTQGGVCAFGCYPASPALSRPGAETNCYQSLRYELVMFFFVHIFYTMAFLLWPMVKVKIDMLLELRRASKVDDADSEVGRRGSTRYSWLQYQAKCPSYTYMSWGGSRMEDFLECAIGYALITCFGILFPVLAAFAFLANLVEYRLLAYRMTHVTCRPLPRGASGIGSWQWVFETISGVAVVANVCLIAFVMRPMRSMSRWHQFGIFIVLEHILLGIRYLLDNVIPECPQDVRRIDDFNAHFKSMMVKYPPLAVPPTEQYEEEYEAVDLALLPKADLELSCNDLQGATYEEDDSDDDSLETTELTAHFEDGSSGWCPCESHKPLRPL